MSTSCTSWGRSSDDLISIVSLLVLGAGFVAMFAELDYFFVIWIIGFTVLVPIIGILSGEREDESEGEDDEWNVADAQHEVTNESTATDSHSSTSTQDALSTLRERYAQGDLTDEQFERKLDRLLETETPESAAEWRRRAARDIETENA